MLKKNFLLGIGITNALEKDILEFILKNLKTSSKKYYIATPNPEILVFANKNNGFKNILNNARLALPDGMGVIWAGKILGKNFKERVTGTDLVKNLCKIVAEKPITVGFLGGGPKIAEKTAECLLRRYPELKIVFTGEEWTKDFFTSKQKMENGKWKMERSSSIDILFVAFGFPKQEIWMSENIHKLPVKVMIGVGGAFDYISDKVPRAPIFLQKLGFEWLYRLIRQPRRLRRQLALIEFIYFILKEKFRTSLSD